MRVFVRAVKSLHFGRRYFSGEIPDKKLQLINKDAFATMNRIFLRVSNPNYDFSSAKFRIGNLYIYENTIDPEVFKQQGGEKGVEQLKHMISRVEYIRKEESLDLLLPHNPVGSIKCSLQDLNTKRHVRYLSVEIPDSGDFLVGIVFEFKNLVDLHKKDVTLDSAFINVGPDFTNKIDNIDLFSALMLGRLDIIHKYEQQK